MSEKLKTRLWGGLCPPGSAHNRYFRESLASKGFREDRPFNPSPELLRQMDEEQAAFGAGDPNWMRLA